ncbi:unnamed protein product [Trichobilharzia regenti]|nr:unnamed protein product [Trichobilharzia regenti]
MECELNDDDDDGLLYKEFFFPTARVRVCPDVYSGNGQFGDGWMDRWMDGWMDGRMDVIGGVKCSLK